MAGTSADSTEGKLEARDDGEQSVDSSESVPVRMIIVANELPLKAEQRDDGNWSFSWDEDSLLFQIKDGFPRQMVVFYVGCLSMTFKIPEDKQQEVSKTLIEEFNCVPTFLPPEISDKFYHCFCKRHLWPLLHDMVPLSFERLDQSLWDAYVSANMSFAKRVMEVANPEQDYIWIHDYHLMVLPSFLREIFIRMKIGFVLHTPFPSSEIYRTLSVREEILKSLLNCDVIGFHTYNYARHFLSCCSRILGLEHKLDKSFLELEYYGRNIRIKVMPVGIHMGRIESVMKMVEGDSQVKTTVQDNFAGKTVLVGIDDVDVFKGIDLKFLAMESMLKQRPEARGTVVLVQIINPARGKGIYYDQILDKIKETSERINNEFEQPDYRPIVLIEGPLCTKEKFTYYSMAECLLVTPLRDGMNLHPYEYIACRQKISGFKPSSSSHRTRKSMLVISEFMGCSSLSKALRVNPWNIEDVATKMHVAISMDDSGKQSRHRKHYEYIRNHDVAHWSASFFEDMKRTWDKQCHRICWGVNHGLHFRVVSANPSFGRLPLNTMESYYRKAKIRAILLDYDGTLIPLDAVDKSPSERIISALNDLCADMRNVVFIVSGRGRDSLREWFKSCKNLGIAAEHGFFMRLPGSEEWEALGQSLDMSWIELAERTMELYAAGTDGSFIERKEHALVWNYQNADAGFGSSQAKELLCNLADVLANDPVTVKSGKFIVEAKSQGVNKGTVAKMILKSVTKKEAEGDEFIMCIGDDKSDEDMFKILNAVTVEGKLSSPSPIFTCTINQKPTEAKYYLEDPNEVMNVLEQLASASRSYLK